MPANALELNAAEALLQLQLGPSNCRAQLKTRDNAAFAVQDDKKNDISSCMRQIAELKSSKTAHCGIIRRHNTSAVLQNTRHNREATLNGRSRQSSEIQAPDFTGRFMICSTPISETNQFGSPKTTAVSTIKGSPTSMTSTYTMKHSVTSMALTSTINYSDTYMAPKSPINGSHTPMTPTSTIKDSPTSMNSTYTIKRWHTPVTPISTCDQGTQTDNSITGYSPTTVKHYTEQIDRMEIIIKELYRHFLHLANHLNAHRQRPLSTSTHPATDNASTSDTTEPVESEHEHEIRSSLEQDVSNTTGEHSGSNSNGSIKGESAPNARMLHVRRVSAHTTNIDETSYEYYNKTESIGCGNTVVPSRLLKNIDWTSYSTATRQLLQAVFSRRVLATHSLTGKQSPAFMDKPPKKRLDPRVVNDIVDTVADRCGVFKRLVRSSITTKCADESKLFRNRQQYRHARHDQANVPPASPSSDEYVSE